MTSTKDAEALALLLRAGIETLDAPLVARMVAAAEQMRAGLARQPRDLPPGLEPASAFAVKA
jgi:hypothetical protein